MSFSVPPSFRALSFAARDAISFWLPSPSFLPWWELETRRLTAVRAGVVRQRAARLGL